MLASRSISQSNATTKGTVIYKKKKVMKMTGNYRLVSIQSVFSKSLGKKLYILLRMELFADKHNLIGSCQFGFSKHRSTELALLARK